MTMEAIATTVAAAGGAGVLGAIVNGIVNRRKLGADATEAITRAASGIVDRLESDNARLREERKVDHKLIRTLEAKVDALVTVAADREKWFTIYQDSFTKMFEIHARFDRDLVARLREHGETDLPEPPPLELPVIAASHDVLHDEA